MWPTSCLPRRGGRSVWSPVQTRTFDKTHPLQHTYTHTHTPTHAICADLLPGGTVATAVDALVATATGSGSLPAAVEGAKVVMAVVSDATQAAALMSSVAASCAQTASRQVRRRTCAELGMLVSL